MHFTVYTYIYTYICIDAYVRIEKIYILISIFILTSS